MLSVRLKEFINEDIPRREIDNGLGWHEWRALNLIDETNGNHIAEWFYAVACNKYYFDKKVLPSKDGPVGYFIQEEFNEADLLSSAQEVVKGLSFKDWDDFYKKMSENFIYEDDEE